MPYCEVRKGLPRPAHRGTVLISDWISSSSSFISDANSHTVTAPKPRAGPRMCCTTADMIPQASWSCSLLNRKGPLILSWSASDSLGGPDRAWTLLLLEHSEPRSLLYILAQLVWIYRLRSAGDLSSTWAISCQTADRRKIESTSFYILCNSELPPDDL